MKFSANLGFLWADRPLPDRIRAAKLAGFDAVELHWPFDVEAELIRDVLVETGLPLLSLNTTRGNVHLGENGLSALPGREAEARAAIDQALLYASQTQARAVHVMAGVTGDTAAHRTFVQNLDYACQEASRVGIKILIEPLNPRSAPGYFLDSTNKAAEIIGEVGSTNLRLLFDCFHVQIIEGDVTSRLERLLPVIGHIQIAAVPDRGAPDHGELNYDFVLVRIAELGWRQPIGVEYIAAEVDLNLNWLKKYKHDR